MAVDLTLIKKNIADFNRTKKFINERKDLIRDTSDEPEKSPNKLEVAFDTLKEKNFWHNKSYFELTETEFIESIKKLRKKFDTKERELSSNLGEFAACCAFFFTKDEDIFEAFQAVMQNKTPLDSSIILRLYEKTFGTLQNTADYDEIHKKTNGNTLYELFSFEPDTYTFSRLKTLANNEDVFRNHPLGDKGKWDDLTLFALVLKDEQSKEKYDAYYRFLMCKKILKDVYRQYKSLVSYKYLEIVSKLEKYNICENSKQAEKLLVPFCTEIRLKCLPTTDEKVAEDEKRTESKRKRIEEIVNQLKVKQKELESSLKGIGNDIDNLFSSIDSLITDMSVKIRNIKNTSKAIYKEDDKIKELDRYIADLQKLETKIREVESSRLDTSSFIAKEVKNADDKQKEITSDNVIDIFNDVNSKDAVIWKRYKEFIDKYNNEKTVKTQLTELKSRFSNKEKEINAGREKISGEGEILNDHLRKYHKPITRRFIGFQLILLIIINLYSPVFPNLIKQYFSIFFYLNMVGFVIYIVLVCRQFEKFNKSIESKRMISNEKITYPKNSKGNLEKYCARLLEICVYVFVGNAIFKKSKVDFDQYKKNMRNSLLILITIWTLGLPWLFYYIFKDYKKDFELNYRDRKNLTWSIIVASLFFIVVQCGFLLIN